MIKTVIKLESNMDHGDKLSQLKQVEQWMNENFGPAVTHDNNKQRRRKKWSVKINFWPGGSTNGNLEIYTRDPQNATLVALRWS